MNTPERDILGSIKATLEYIAVILTLTLISGCAGCFTK